MRLSECSGKKFTKLIRLRTSCCAPHAMVVAHRHRGDFGFTEGRHGRNLPLVYAPWKLSIEGSAMLIRGDHDVFMEGIDRRGYFLTFGNYDDEPPTITHRPGAPL